MENKDIEILVKTMHSSYMGNFNNLNEYNWDPFLLYEKMKNEVKSHNLSDKEYEYAISVICSLLKI